MSTTKWSPAMCAALAQARKRDGETVVPTKRARGPYTTSTPVASMRRMAGDGYGFTTDPARQRAATDAERNARRRAALDVERGKLVGKCAFHRARKDWDNVREVSAKIAHVDMLIVRGEQDGRW